MVARYNVYRTCGAQAALLQHERHVRALPHRAERLPHFTGNYHLCVALLLYGWKLRLKGKKRDET